MTRQSFMLYVFKQLLKNHKSDLIQRTLSRPNRGDSVCTDGQSRGELSEVREDNSNTFIPLVSYLYLWARPCVRHFINHFTYSQTCNEMPIMNPFLLQIVRFRDNINCSQTQEDQGWGWKLRTVCLQSLCPSNPQAVPTAQIGKTGEDRLEGRMGEGGQGRREEKGAGKLRVLRMTSWDRETLHKLRTPKILTFFEDSIDRETQQCALKEKQQHQLPCRLPEKPKSLLPS